MKVIFRADDVGYTDTHNLGTWKAMDEGVVTACDLMLDCPGFEDACKKLRNYPWITIGWHTHFWGRPVLDPSEVPSMVNEEGRFKWRKDHKALFEVDYNEALRECHAQLDRCYDLLGRYPDVTGLCYVGPGGSARVANGTANDRKESPLNMAIRQACDDYGIVYGFTGGVGYGGRVSVPADKYKDLNIQEWVDHSHKHTKSLNVVDFPYYDPLGAIMEMPIDDSIIWLRSQHPGYLDDYVLSESSCTIPRVKDVEAYSSPILKQWIIDNKIELVNTTDALYGTNKYQEHLKEINSPLYMGK
ncbi:MAG: ChbG/HpnK family deacetylase [Erysipelotrichaceae bacterium]|nr:ChbG/HpnK family deacetylase [Erysipelotrichaceae bacterium]